MPNAQHIAATTIEKYGEWLDRLNSGNARIYEKLGALHYGSIFFDSTDCGVRVLALSFYLKMANRIKNDQFYDEELIKKARSVLTNNFFKKSIDLLEEGDYFMDLGANPDNRLLDGLMDFLCCSERGMSLKIDWFKWNYWYIDENISDVTSRKIYNEDRVISSFFGRLLWFLFRKDSEISCKKKWLLKTELLPYKERIVREIFIRAPWQILPFKHSKWEVRALENATIKYLDVYPRAFSGKPEDNICERIQDIPYIALPTRAEVLLILKSRRD